MRYCLLHCKLTEATARAWNDARRAAGGLQGWGFRSGHRRMQDAGQRACLERRPPRGR